MHSKTKMKLGLPGLRQISLDCLHWRLPKKEEIIRAAANNSKSKQVKDLKSKALMFLNTDMSSKGKLGNKDNKSNKNKNNFVVKTVVDIR